MAESKSNTKRVLSEHAKPSAPSSGDEVQRFLTHVPAGHYVAIMAYLPPTAENDRRLETVRLQLRDRLKVATTVGYGPRFLHSTGQLHKGGPPIGHFIQIVDPVPTNQDMAIPDEPFTFGTLESAQAEGDLQALVSRDRPVVRVAGIDALEQALGRAFARG